MWLLPRSKSSGFWGTDDMALSQHQQQFFGRASCATINSCVGDLRHWWAGGSWLSPWNRYRRNCIEHIRTDTQTGRRVTHSHLRQYIAGSIVLHCFDGWAFLGRALQAELTGDSDVARHLAYYAELRAAMSLLASEGVGVFGQQHAVVNKKSRCEIFAGQNSSTHRFVWNALQYWASTPAGVRTVFRAIRPGGVVLEDWLNQFSAGVNFIAGKWLVQWGLDLERLSQDRDARNVASYRPTAFTSPGPKVIADTLDSIMCLWEMCEPGGASPFARLDRHLLRRSLELAFKDVHAYGRTHRQAKRMYEQQVTTLLNNVSPRELSAAQWRAFLTDEQFEPTSSILADAASKHGPEHENHSREVVARAFLLLRVASGAAQEHLERAAPNAASELEFWWASPAVARSLWPGDEPPMSFIDLWTDVKEAMGSIRLWLDNPDVVPSHFSLWRDQAAAAAVLGTPERVALWGLGL